MQVSVCRYVQYAIHHIAHATVTVNAVVALDLGNIHSVPVFFTTDLEAPTILRHTNLVTI